MRRVLSRPWVLALGVAALVLMVVSVLGGAVGSALGGGFLGSPMPTIQLPAEKVVSIGAYDVLNSSVMFWAAMLVLIALSLRVRRRIALVPGRLQSVFEAVMEFFAGIAEPMAGRRVGRRFLPLVMTIFLGVLVSNWLGILPGVGTIGRIETPEEYLAHHAGSHEAAALEHAAEEEAGHKFVAFEGSGSFYYIPFGRGEDTKVPLSGIDYRTGEVVTPPEEYGDLAGKNAGILVPFLRGASTDLNTTLAIALVAMTTVQIWGFMTLGFRGYGKRFLDFRGGPFKLFVGILEIFGEIARVVSFTFRLFGNMFAGEVLLIAMGFLLPLIGLIPFLGLELFVGLIQAFIFAMLTLVFGAIAVTPHGEEH